ncbi:MAG: hypothetical protein ACU0BF_03945 [Paracoccaceae bacterium]
MVLQPLVPWAVLAGLVALALVAVALAAWRGLPGWWLRGLAGAALVAALANPSWRQADETPLPDVLIALVDRSASNRIDDRAARTDAALSTLQAQAARDDMLELREVTVGDDPDDGGTRLMAALDGALADVPRGRLAGVVAITDGRASDMDAAPALDVPFHALTTGRAGDWDRRLTVTGVPAFAILGEPVTLRLRIDDEGDVPIEGATADLTISVDGAEPYRFTVPTNQTLDLPVDLPHGGVNVLQFATPMLEGELTDRNNGHVARINGVRDRLRVLLVSGEPYPGGRTWRNLLKSDGQVDLVHFTILRPPGKFDGVPVDELSLIAFPTRELFLEKIDEFDLIVFDRYQRRGILPAAYFDNIRRYVVEGGAVMVTAGPAFAGADSLQRSALGDVLPGIPSARVLEEGFTPRLTDAGRRHPVTADLDGPAAGDPAAAPAWGRWFRHVEVTPRPDATVAMTGAGDRPLLLLDRVGDGRVALMASDQIWLWGRGFEGGGPQLELLRRVAHWTMREPELEEEALRAQGDAGSLRIIRRTLSDGTPPAQVTGPDGEMTEVPLAPAGPGVFEAEIEAPELGLYRVAQGDLTAVAAVGPPAPREFTRTIAGPEDLAPIAEVTGGQVRPLSDGQPSLRAVRAGRPAAGRGWIGYVPQGATTLDALRVTALLPAWAWLLLSASLILGAWLREGRGGPAR